jgi:hypothetical protein
MLKALIAACLISVFGVASAATNPAKEIEVSFGKEVQHGNIFAFATNHSSKPLMLKTAIYKVGAFKAPKQYGEVSIKANGKQYNMIETDPAALFVPNTTALFPIPTEAGEYAVKLIAFDDQPSGKELSSLQLFNVQQSGQHSKAQR